MDLYIEQLMIWYNLLSVRYLLPLLVLIVIQLNFIDMILVLAKLVDWKNKQEIMYHVHNGSHQCNLGTDVDFRFVTIFVVNLGNQLISTQKHNSVFKVFLLMHQIIAILLVMVGKVNSSLEERCFKLVLMK